MSDVASNVRPGSTTIFGVLAVGHPPELEVGADASELLGHSYARSKLGSPSIEQHAPSHVEKGTTTTRARARSAWRRLEAARSLIRSKVAAAPQCLPHVNCIT
ncbi:unnamed protein product [Prorocentrum cordatum]|uniref:Uncharacterized protein n=1 Tax=Prorocentrum cordatum TaxID=2364126 RepID=A0ABN9VAL0_9DINO|nr:unnamed protein product [Polarella glacialis]